MQYPIGHIFIWSPTNLSFKTAGMRSLLSDFMETEEVYLQIVEGFGNIIDLNIISDNAKLAEDVYRTMNSDLKNKLQEFLESGR